MLPREAHIYNSWRNKFASARSTIVFLENGKHICFFEKHKFASHEGTYLFPQEAQLCFSKIKKFFRKKHRFASTRLLEKGKKLYFQKKHRFAKHNCASQKDNKNRENHIFGSFLFILCFSRMLVLFVFSFFIVLEHLIFDFFS